MSQRPNLLFLWTDEQRADTLSCYGNNIVQAPHLNQLAQRSFVFENAYCTQPVCTPSRASILTGTWPHTHGCVVNNSPLPTDIPTIAELLSDDYQCAYYGKWHLGDEIMPQRGFDEWVSYEDGAYRAYYTQPEFLEKRSDYHHFLVEQGYAPNTVTADGARVFSRNFAAGLAEPYTKAHFLGERAAEFLRRQKGDSPFMLSVNFLEPHMPFFGPLNNRYSPGEVPQGPAFAQKLGEGAALRNRILAAQYAERGIGGYEIQTEAQFRRLRANYYGLVTLVDNAIGRILQALEESGQADNTIIVFTSDHGDMMGDHGLVAKCVMYEPSIRIPLLLHVPGQTAQRIPGPISQVDLVPTLLDLMGQSVPGHLQGCSRVAVLREEEELGDAVVEWNPYWAPAGKQAPPGFTDQEFERVTHQTWRTLIGREGWKINVCADDQCEMYDLNHDPHELYNLWDDTRYAVKRADLLQRLQNWRSANNDTASVLPAV